MGKKAGGRRRGQDDEEEPPDAAPSGGPPPRKGSSAQSGARALDGKTIALKSFHGKHVKAEANGEVKAISGVIKDAEKFDVSLGADGWASLKSHLGKYLEVDAQGEVRATGAAPEEIGKFQLLLHDDGSLSLKSKRSNGYIAAEARGGKLRANRTETGAWERFEWKDRSKKGPAHETGDPDSAPATPQVAPVDATPLFDAFCQLQDVLLAEENYARTHNDNTAYKYKRRVASRRQQGVHLSFRHFCQEHSYPATFRGCVSAFDATVARLPREQAPSGEEEEAEAEVGDFDPSQYESALAWQTILAEAGDLATGAPPVYAAFGVPSASAAEADERVFTRLAELCKTSRCVAVGPVGLDLAQPKDLEPPSERLVGLSAAAFFTEFGSPPKAAYDPMLDPVCVAWLSKGNGLKAETWVLKHGDRRRAEFDAAAADYSRRRLQAQVPVAERQVKLALELGLPLVVQLPPQDEAERRLAEVLMSVLPEGSSHPVLLSAFHGRPKCAGALLKHFPGVMVGFSGLLTHGKVKESLGEVAFDTPLDRCLLESVGPRYAPSVEGSARGSYSHSMHVVDAAEELARVKGIPAQQVREAAFANVQRFYRLPTEATAALGCLPEAAETDAPEDSEAAG